MGRTTNLVDEIVFGKAGYVEMEGLCECEATRLTLQYQNTKEAVTEPDELR